MGKVKFKGGYGYISSEIGQNEEIPIEAKGLYCILATFAKKESRECWPSIDTLLRKSGMSKTSLYKYMEILVQCGVVEKQYKQQAGHENLKGSVIYKLKDTEE